MLQINVVKETRPYTLWGPAPKTPNEVGMESGITAAKAELNTLHKELADQGFNQVSWKSIGKS